MIHTIRQFFKKLFCKHLWLDLTVPFSDIEDMEGGWHECIHCGSKRYIRWGAEYKALDRQGKIKHDEETEAYLMKQYTGW